MSGERARDALAQCLPDLVKRLRGANNWGYRMAADNLDEELERRGFKIISQATYDRLNISTGYSRRPYREVK